MQASGIAARKASWGRFSALFAEVVTVHGDETTSGRPGIPPTTPHVFTEVFDAPTGSLIIEGVGVDAIQ